MKKAILFTIILVLFISGSVSACGKRKDLDLPDLTEEALYTLEPAALSFCFKGYSPTGQPDHNQRAINEMLEELNREISGPLNATLTFEWIPYEQYDEKLRGKLAANEGPDAFDASAILYTPDIDKLARDITSLFPQYAPGYYQIIADTVPERLKITTFEDRIFAIPSMLLYSARYCAIAQKDLVDNYLGGNLNTMEDLGRLAEAVSRNEPEMIPIFAQVRDIFAAFMTGSGVYETIHTLYSPVDTDEFTAIPIEQTEAFLSACELFKEWKESGYLVDDIRNASGQIIQDKFGAFLTSIQTVHLNNDHYGISDKYMAYPLYTDQLFRRVDVYDFTGININSRNPERVIMFIEWLQSDQNNYDLLMHGIRDRHYTVQGNALRISPYINRSENLSAWWGSDLFKNYIYERPFVFEPSDYKAYMEKCALGNTVGSAINDEEVQEYRKMAPEEKAKYESLYNELFELAYKRYEVYRNFLQQIEQGNFDRTLRDMMDAEDNDKLADIVDRLRTEENQLKQP